MTPLTIVIEDFNASGGLRVLTAVANVAAEQGISISVICPDYSPLPYFAFDTRVQVRRLHTGHRLRRARFAWAVARGRATSDGPFFTSSYRLIGVAALVGALFRRERSVLLVQGLDDISLIKLAPTAQPAKLVNTILLWLSRRVPCHRIFVSQFLRRTLAQKGELIPNFVAPEFLRPVEASRPAARMSAKMRVGCVSTSAPNKGFDLFLDTVRLLARDPRLSHLEIEFACATQDELLRRSSASSEVAFWGPQSDSEMRDFYRSCDVVLSLSVSEGFGLPVLEAMASCCAVVCTDSGGVTDFVVPGQTGVLVTERSAVEVASQVAQLLLDPQTRHRIAETGRSAAQRYTYARFSAQYSQFFRQLGLMHV